MLFAIMTISMFYDYCIITGGNVTNNLLNILLILF